MSDNDLLKQFEKLIIKNNEALKKAFREELEVEIEKLAKSGARERVEILVRLDRTANETKDVAIGLSKLEKSQEYTAETVQETRQELGEKIRVSQQDTIEVLSDLINTGYNLHEERIQRLEDNVGLPPLVRKH